jgi:hypothetical protein
MTAGFSTSEPPEPGAPDAGSDSAEPPADLWETLAAAPGYEPGGWHRHHRLERVDDSGWIDPSELPDAGPAGRGPDWGWSAGVGPPVSIDPIDSVLPDLPDDFGDEAARVRPYAWTRGRTKPNYDLKVETLVSTTELGCEDTLLTQVEYRSVGTLCRHPHSVAEVAAKLAIPLGVARVLLSDMADLGLISIHRSFADDDIAAHLVLMERVLSGLRRL